MANVLIDQTVLLQTVTSAIVPVLNRLIYYQHFNLNGKFLFYFQLTPTCLQKKNETKHTNNDCGTKIVDIVTTLYMETHSF